jgi:hypothetical protein
LAKPNCSNPTPSISHFQFYLIIAAIKHGDKKCKAAIMRTNVTATGVVATAIMNTAYGAAAAGDATAAVADTTHKAAAKVVDTTDNAATTDSAATTGDAAAEVTDTADNAAAAGNAAAKVEDTADIVATTDVAATANNVVTYAVAVAAIPAVTTTNANATDNADIVNSIQVSKSSTTKIGKVTYPNATTAAGGNTGTTTGEKNINSKHIMDSVSVDRAVDALIGVYIHMCDSSIVSVKLSLLD